jgi:predicted nucleic acid-binding protein
MKYVLDSSVAFKWVVPEVDSDKAERLRDDVRAAVHDLLAPDVFFIEVGHALTRAERQGRVSTVQGWSLWLSVMSDCPRLSPSLPLMPRAYAIASQARIGIYDCLYIALAERDACDLITADDKLVKNLRRSFPFITPLASLP